MGCTPSKSAVNTVVPVSTLALSPSSNINNTAVSTKSKHYHHHALTHPVNPNVNGHHQNASDSANSYTAKSIIADYPIVPPSAETINGK